MAAVSQRTVNTATTTLRFSAMGCPCAIHADKPAAAEAARAEVLRLERKYSRYRDDSVLSRINAAAGNAQGCVLDDETAALLDYAATAHAQSDGLFDATAGVLRQAWNFRGDALPPQSQIDGLLPRIGWQRLGWERPRLTLPVGMELDFGGFVKEYAADGAAAAARTAGARSGLVDLGGDLAVIGPHADGAPWRVGIRDPRNAQRPVATIALDVGGLASSGNYERCLRIAGKVFGHILDPRTGWPVTGGFAAVSVRADSCLIAGTVTTVAMLKGRSAGSAWLDSVGLPHLSIAPDGQMAGTLKPAG